MINYDLGEVQEKFAELIWENEPIKSGDLVKLCSEKFDWKKSTTYTVLKKLCEKQLFKNENGIVTSIVSSSEYNACKSEKFINDSFNGSFPAFLAAFSKSKKLSDKEIQEIQNMIDKYKKE